MISTTVGRLLIDDALPHDLRDKAGELNKKGVQRLFQEIAERYPEQYRDITQKLMKIGADASFTSGGYSFSLRHLLPANAALKYREQVQRQVDQILDNGALSDTDKQQAILKAVSKVTEPMEKEIYEESLAEKNPLALQVASGAKGNPTNLRSLRGGDLLYVDHRDQPVPIPVLKSYSEGLTPAQYYAGSFGARKGVVDLKLSTADAGYYAKQLSQASHRLLVTAKDSDKQPHPDTPVGLPTTVNDADNEGAFLAAKAGPYGRNTQLTPKVLEDLKQRGLEHILVRSPMVGGPADGGVYGLDAGVRERGAVAPVGDQVGLAAAASIGEPLSQAQICLAAGTLVRMADWSTKKIEEIEPGEMVLGADKEGMTFPVRVIALHDNGMRDCVSTVFRFMRRKEHAEMISTVEHKILAAANVSGAPNDQYKNALLMYEVGRKAKVFKVGSTCGFIEPAGLKNEPFALFLGLVLGDGCYTKSLGGVFLSCADPMLIADIDPYVKTLNLRMKQCQAGGGLMWRFSQIVQAKTQQDPQTGRVLPGSRNPAKKILESYGMYGKYAHEKTLPADVFSWDNDSVAALLAGLFATDGSIYQPVAGIVGKPHLNFASTSSSMVAQVRDLLSWRFGVHAGTIKDNDYGGRKRSLYSIVVTDADSINRFAAAIPLVGIKRITLKNSLTGWGQKRLVPYRPRRISQSPVGIRFTYDLEVDHPEHKFLLANGLCVANSSKHSGGVAGALKGVSGFKLLNQLTQVPKTFPGGAAHSQLDGKVDSVSEAPQGGHYVTVHGEQHYVAQGQDVTVKPGQQVEAGDTLSEGIPNPAEIVQHFGIGEGRRRYVDQFSRAAKSAGFSPHRRNLELIARGLINHVRLTDEVGDYVPDDVVPYSTIAGDYQPREDHQRVTPRQAVGKYLEQGVLHHTIGTRIRPSMLEELERHGVKSVAAHHEPPPFESVMVRGQDNLSKDPDWMTRMFSSHQEKNLLRGVHRADVSDPHGTSFVPSLAQGLGFGTQGKVKGFDPKDLKT